MKARRKPGETIGQPGKTIGQPGKTIGQPGKTSRQPDVRHGAIPPMRELQSALRMITETLARELAQPTETVPSWSDQEWILARAVAATHGVAPLLWSNLRWQGPADWRSFLERQASHTQRRHVRILELLRLLDRRCAEDGIAATALKGAALHAMGLYRAGERPMADIDVLVRPVDAERTAAMLRSLGFRESIRNWKEREFTPQGNGVLAALGEHADNHIKIELHERISEKLPLRITAVTERVFPALPRAGLNDYPSRAALMLHLLFHAAGAMTQRSLRLLHLHDLALLGSRLESEEWEAVFDSGSSGSLWWALPPLRLTARYYGFRIPATVLARASQDCPRVLTKLTAAYCLTDVSYSHLRIDAFPGVEWSESVPLALKYVWSRCRPPPEHIAWRLKAQSTGWAAGSEWSAMSQGRRMLRWLGSRPARPVAMHAVRAAFSAQQ